MPDPEDDAPLPADLRFLKALVTTLAGVMILGLLAIVWLLVTRLGAAPVMPVLPDTIALPDGAAPVAITFAREWLVVVTDAGTVLLYDREGGPPVSTTRLP